MANISLYKKRNIAEAFQDTFQFLTENALPLWVAGLGLYFVFYWVQQGIDWVNVTFFSNDYLSPGYQIKIIVTALFQIFWSNIEITIWICIVYGFVKEKMVANNNQNDDYSFLKIDINDFIEIFKLSLIPLIITTITATISTLFVFVLTDMSKMGNGNVGSWGSLGSSLGYVIYYPIWGLSAGLVLVHKYTNLRKALKDAYLLGKNYRLYFVSWIVLYFFVSYTGSMAIRMFIPAGTSIINTIFTGLLFIIMNIFNHTLHLLIYGSAIYTNQNIVDPTKSELDMLIDSLGEVKDKEEL